MPQYKFLFVARPERVSTESETTPGQGYKYVNEKPNWFPNILRRNNLTINRILLNQFYIYDGDQYIAKMPDLGQFDWRQFNVFLWFFPSFKYWYKSIFPAHVNYVSQQRIMVKVMLIYV